MGFGTVRRFKNFTTTQILHEIKFDNFRGSKLQFWIILDALNFDIFENSTFESVEIPQRI